MPIHLHSQKINDGNAHQSQSTGVYEGSAYSADQKVIGDQKVRLNDDGFNTVKNTVQRLEIQARQDKINRNDGQQHEFLLPV